MHDWFFLTEVQEQNKPNLCFERNWQHGAFSSKNWSKLKVQVPGYGFPPVLQHHNSISQLCICNKCQAEYGSYELFSHIEGVVNEFLMGDSICAVSANSKSSDTVWFVRPHSNPEEVTAYITNDYGHNQDKHAYMHQTMRSKKQSEILRSTC